MTKVHIRNSDGEHKATIEVDSSKILLPQIEEAGIPIPHACDIGICGSCICFSGDGDRGLVKNLTGEPAFPLGEGEIMTCIGGISEGEDEITLETMD